MADAAKRMPKFSESSFQDRLKQAPSRISAWRASTSDCQAVMPVGGIASPVVWGIGGGLAAALKASANSGKLSSAFHSGIPSVQARLLPLSLPPTIQARTSSTETGPYCFPSPPRILYIALINGEHRLLVGDQYDVCKSVPLNGDDSAGAFLELSRLIGWRL